MAHNWVQVLIENRELSQAVKALPTPVLTRMVQYIGLEDAGDLVPLLTGAQLRNLLNEDVWHLSHGKEGQIAEKFSKARFLTWLEVLVELGPHYAIERLNELDDEFLFMAFGHCLAVFNSDEMAIRGLNSVEPGLGSDGIEKVLGRFPSLELEEFLIVARQDIGWDAISEIIQAWDHDDHTGLVTLLEKVARHTGAEIGRPHGLEHLLSLHEEMNEDAKHVRDEARTQDGYISTSNALAFLNLIRLKATELVTMARPGVAFRELSGDLSPDPIWRDYQNERGWREAESGRQEQAAARASQSAAKDSDQDLATAVVPHASVTRIMSFLQSEGILSNDNRSLELGHASKKDQKLPWMVFLSELSSISEDLHQHVLQQMGFLGNALMAGASVEGRRIRASEATEAVIHTCNLAWQQIQGQGSDGAQDLAIPSVREWWGCDGAIQLFRMGFAMIYQDLSVGGRKWILETIEVPPPELTENATRYVREARDQILTSLRDKKHWQGGKKIRGMVRIFGETKTQALVAATDELPHFRSPDQPTHLEFYKDLSEVQAAVQALLKH